MGPIVKTTLLAAALALLAACAPQPEVPPQATPETAQTVSKAPAATLDEQHLNDNPLLYANDADDSVVTMYLTVSRGNAAENTDHSWAEINTFSTYDYEDMGVERYQAAALLQMGDENGPLPGTVGYGETVPNATVQIRGQTSSRNAQKNYKIELKEGAGLWNGQRTIALNKHQTDSLRFRNKLANDLLEEVDELMALRTQFVHLYVKDETGPDPDQFVDYGLYTQVEQLNKTALRSHGLDKAGYLYKINYFEFYRYEDVIKPNSDPTFDRAAMDDRLEAKGEQDNTRLIELLEAVNDLSLPTDRLLDEWFDRENLAYWMAFEILLGNSDTQSRNFYLYSPLNGHKWYIIPWDHDAAMMKGEWELEGYVDSAGWEQGVSNYWGNVLFQRALKTERFRAELDAAVEDLHSRFTRDKLAAMVETYLPVVKPYAFSMPDVGYIGVTSRQYDAIAAGLPDLIESYYQSYKASLDHPMPFYVDAPAVGDGTLSLSWQTSYDFDAEDITYHVTLARDYLYRDVLLDTVTDMPAASLPDPGRGQYFLNVTATNASGFTQDCFDYYVTDRGKVYGTYCFYLDGTGDVEVHQIEE